MTSPDFDDPLSYLDSGKIFDLIDVNWEIFSYGLIEKQAWDGRRSELLKIRHRIGHLRRPHADDLNRIEQTLRDLESGAFRTISSYNRSLDVFGLDQSDPIISGWIHANHEDAKRLIDHAARNYDVHLRISYTVRPWAASLDPGSLASGTPGILWRIELFARRSRLNVVEFWRDSHLHANARELMIHLLVENESRIAATFAAIDDSNRICDAIGELFDSFVVNLTRFEAVDIDGNPIRRARISDPRVHIETPWTVVDDTTVPVTIFCA